MPEESPIACSLEAEQLRQRLDEIEAVGARGLIDHRREGSRHLLRFNADEEIRQRLERIVAAESQCCPFLELWLKEQDSVLLLTLAAPADGQVVAEELARAFVGRPA
jgi:hypothetical protein